MPSIALVTAVASMNADDDLAPLAQACERAGLRAAVLAWDDPTVSWQRFDVVLLRSPWNYIEHHAAFLRWCDRIDASSLLLNPLPVLRWNTDKHYLLDLQRGGLAVVPSTFIERHMEPLPALQAFLDADDSAELVVKPAISAGSRDTQRYARAQQFAASNHIARLLDCDRTVMLQPYLPSVDSEGETALVFLDGEFSHAIRKAALLPPGDTLSVSSDPATGISAREPAQDERALALQVLAAVNARFGLSEPLPYARVDLIRDAQGQPQVLELELTEPSLFLAHGPGSAERLAGCVARRLERHAIRARTDCP